MSLTLREILDLDVLRRGGARVVAGRKNLDQTVRWVHVTELPDIAHLLHGGELLLTTGMGITSNPEMQHRYIAELAEAGVSGVVIELGRNFNSVPTAMIRSAEKFNLPIIALERETRFVEITETVHREIINHQHKMFNQAERVSRDLTELIINGAEAAQIVSRLAEIFGNHVVLEDEAHQVIEIAGPASGTGALLSTWQEHSRTNHEGRRSGTVHHNDGDPACMWVELWLRHDPWGRLHVLATNSRFEESTELLVDRAGAAIALSLLSEKDAAHMADRARGALVAEVVAGRHGSGVEFLRRAQNLGTDLGHGPLVAIAIETVETTETINRRELTEEHRLYIRLNIADELRTSARDQGCAALVALSGDRVIAVMADSGNRPLIPLSEDAINSAAERIALRDTSVEIFAGTSEEITADALPKGIEEATTALNFGRRSGTGRRVHHFSDLGTYHLLMSLAQGPDLAKFVEYELQALLDHDAHVRGKLLPTLRAYLIHAGRKSDTVRDLGIQRRTLYARLVKIEAILRRDLENQDTRTRLTLALQGLELLQDRWTRNTTSRQKLSRDEMPF
jgi:purine catabolism regulator